jgi:hypothetical protein
MRDEILVFDGVKWPKVRITGTGQAMHKFAGNPGASAPPPTFFDLAPEGTGRRYRARGTAGWWRDLAAMDTNDREQVLAFLARRGDPAGRLEQAALNAARARLGQPLGEDPKPGTNHWFGLQVTLKTIAAAWSAADTEGISVIDDDARWTEAKYMWRFTNGDAIGRDLELIPDPDEKRPFVVRAKTLGAYMEASAVSSLYRRAQMRTCARCGSWFEFAKAHARYCSLSCRAMAHDHRRA